jgi:GT2 family glycosyltransferase
MSRQYNKMEHKVPTPVSVSVVIVSYNTRQMTLDCLRTLKGEVAASGMTVEILVVDNGSMDGSAAAVRQAFPDVIVIENPRNAGFGAANNLAMQRAAGKYLLLLNSDAFLLPGALAAMVQLLDARVDVDVVGPRLLNRDGSLQVSCFPFPSPMRAWVENLWLSAALPNHEVVGDYRRWKHDSERVVDWVVGACMLVRRSTYERVGGFDERFFMYAEETDWQRRIRDTGQRILFTPAAEVTHLGGASGAADKPKVNRSFFDSLDYYERKHHGLAGLILVRAAMAVGCALRVPLWAGVYVLRPTRREVARAKVKLLSWLVVRQTTHWSLGAGKRTGA